MEYGAKMIKSIVCLFVFFISSQTLASETDFSLHIHVQYQQKTDTWKVRYELPIAGDHVAFSRQSNFDRRKLYKIDESKFKWDKAGDVLLIRSVDGSQFKTLDIIFSSFYDFIQKDYTHNLRYSDGSVLLYTNHLALGANIIEDESASPIGTSFSGTLFHFYGPQQNIIFLGNTYKEKAQWLQEGDGTYIYFGNILPIETENFIAIVDPMLPKWAWDNTQEYFPKLFNYYEQQTAQSLNFKPVVFFNYDHISADYSNYSGGTLQGLVQLTVNGSRWKTKNAEQFNELFHFLAHEAAHFWNGQMFTFEDQAHSWMHEGGADAFANFAMREFGLLNSTQMMQKFEEAANSCVLNKGKESLTQSAKLWKYRNYYTCGATMALASHLAIRTKEPSKSFFDVWKRMFNVNMQDKTYNQQDYFDALSHVTSSTALSSALEMFSNQTNIDNYSVVTAWFEQTEISITSSHVYPASFTKHWGKQVIANLMQMHCQRISFSSYDDYIETYAIEGCKAFENSSEIQYLSGYDIFLEGIDAYNFFREKCELKSTVKLQNRQKVDIAEIACLSEVPSVAPYLKFETR